MAMSATASAEINVTPLIDVLLVLLIIFMVIAPVLPRGLNSSIPQGAAAPIAALPPVMVRITRDGMGVPRYRIGPHELAFAELQPALQSAFASRADHTLIVEADRAFSYELVASVVSQARQAGAGAVVLRGVRAS